jgi:hypothetical protein
MAPLFPELRPVVAALSLVASFSALSQSQTVANLPSISFVNNASTSSNSLGIRPAHLWSVAYVKLLWSDTGAVLTAPAHWNEVDWMYAGFAAAGIGAAASLDNTIKHNVQVHRLRAKTDSLISIRTSATLGHSGSSEPSRSGAKSAATRPRKTPRWTP